MQHQTGTKDDHDFGQETSGNVHEAILVLQGRFQKKPGRELLEEIWPSSWGEEISHLQIYQLLQDSVQQQSNWVLGDVG